MKLHLFGASGTGVTTLGEALAEKLGIPYFDSDFYFWEPSNPPFTIRRAPEARNKMIRSHLNRQESWILGGSIIQWGNDVFPPFDLIVFLYLPPATRLARLRNRELNRYGTVILEDSLRNKLYEEFIAWAADYDQETGIASRTLSAHEQWLAKQQVPVLQIREDLTTEQRLKLVLERLNL